VAEALVLAAVASGHAAWYPTPLHRALAVYALARLMLADVIAGAPAADPAALLKSLAGEAAAAVAPAEEVAASPVPAPPKVPTGSSGGSKVPSARRHRGSASKPLPRLSPSSLSRADGEAQLREAGGGVREGDAEPSSDGAL